MNSMQSSPSQSSLSRKIKIRCGERSMNVFVTNNALKKTVLKDYFPEGGTLTYQIDGESYLLDTDAQFIYLNTNVEVYDFNVPKSVSQLSGKRRKRFHDILETLYAGKKSDEKCVKKKMNKINLFYLQKIKKYFHKNYSCGAIIQKLNKKYNVNISMRTLSRILSESKLKRRNVNESPIEKIVLAIILELEGSGCNLGYKSMCQRLKKVYKLKVKQKSVMKALKIIDPEGVEARSRYKLKRRVYSVPGPNYLYHADGYDKLKRFGFAIYGFIDGFSRKVLSLNVSMSNNSPEIIAYYYLQLIEKHGFLPTIIRTDNGTEVSHMESLHIALRFHHTDEHAGEKSFLKGKSTHNQRIESYWRQFRQHMSDFYLNLFKKMENENLIDLSNPLHIDCLRYCFGQLIEEDIKITKKEWNEHRMRKQSGRNVLGGIPNELYYLPENFGGKDYQKLLVKEHIQILFEKYAKKPVLFKPEFKELVSFITDAPIPCTAFEAFNLYIDLIDAIEKEIIDRDKVNY